MHGAAKIKRQTGGFGAYASVSVEMTEVERTEAVSVGLASDAELWRPGVEFGVSYALEKLRDPRRFQVQATLQWLMTDTTQALMAAAAAQAVFAALGRSDLTPPDIDAATRRVCFPM